MRGGSIYLRAVGSIRPSRSPGSMRRAPGAVWGGDLGGERANLWREVSPASPPHQTGVPFVVIMGYLKVIRALQG